MSEIDEEFLDRIADYLDDYSGIPKEVRVRLFAIARRGAEAADEIERLKAALGKMKRSRDRYRQAWEAEKARAALKEEGE